MEKERLHFTIERFDHYYDSVNNKSNIVLGFGTIIFGSLITVYPALSDKVEFTWLMHSLLILTCGLGFVAMMILIFASIPHSKSNGKSVHFFHSISKMGKIDFFNKSEKLSEEDELKDLRTQVFHLSNGLTSKFKQLRIAIYCIVFQMILLIPYIILILTHIKTTSNGNL